MEEDWYWAQADLGKKEFKTLTGQRNHLETTSQFHPFRKFCGGRHGSGLFWDLDVTHTHTYDGPCLPRT